VADYVACFSKLVDQLVAYAHTTDPIYYTMRFIEGFLSWLISTDPDLDIACSLALLQEEVAESSRKRDYHRPDASFTTRVPNVIRGAHPLPPPPCIDKLPPVILPEERKLSESSKSMGEKLSALRQYRRAKGLCDLCAEKWSRDHKCAPTVQLHVVQELLELFSVDQDVDSVSVASGEQLYMALSKMLHLDQLVLRQ
jgi:hypothetical protein